MSLLDHNNQRLFQTVAKQICEQVEKPPYAVNLNRLASVPAEAQTVYWLWQFSCEAGTGGMDKFVLDSLGLYAREIHEALQTVGASELLRSARGTC